MLATIGYIQNLVNKVSLVGRDGRLTGEKMYCVFLLEYRIYLTFKCVKYKMANYLTNLNTFFFGCVFIRCDVPT